MAAARRRARSRPGFGCRCWRTRPGRCAAMSSKSCSSIAHGLTFSDMPIHVSALSPDGRALTIWEDAARTAEGLRSWSARDAAAWPAFQFVAAAARRADRRTLFIDTPPSVDAPGGREMCLRCCTRCARFDRCRKPISGGCCAGGRWRSRIWSAKSFEHELLRATVAADGIFGAMLGPWSAGSGLQLLLTRRQSSARRAPAGRVVRRRAGCASRARSNARVRALGVEIRTGAGVHADRRDGRSRRRRHARRRRATRGARGDLGRRSEAHVPDAVRRRSSAAGVSVAHEATTGRAARSRRSTWRCRRCRRLPARRARCSPGACASRPISITSSAHSITRSTAAISPQPWIEFTIPSLRDPSLAPPGAHVLSAYVQFAPYHAARRRLGYVARRAWRCAWSTRSSSTRRASSR